MSLNEFHVLCRGTRSSFHLVVIHCRRREPLSTLFYCISKVSAVFRFDSSGCLMSLVERRRSTSRVMQLRLVASKESEENSDFILSNPKYSVSTDLTVTTETVP